MGHRDTPPVLRQTTRRPGFPTGAVAPERGVHGDDTVLPFGSRRRGDRRESVDGTYGRRSAATISACRWFAGSHDRGDLVGQGHGDQASLKGDCYARTRVQDIAASAAKAKVGGSSRTAHFQIHTGVVTAEQLS
jgi:hypothetical protein